MAESDKLLPSKPEPEETGSKESQERATGQSLIPEIETERGIGGHPFSDALRDIEPARSSSASILIRNWVEEIVNENREYKKEVRRLTAEVQNVKIENKGLDVTLKAYRKRVNFSLVVVAVGSFGLGFAKDSFEQSMMLGVLVTGFSLFLLFLGLYYGQD